MLHYRGIEKKWAKVHSRGWLKYIRLKQHRIRSICASNFTSVFINSFVQPAGHSVPHKFFWLHSGSCFCSAVAKQCSYVSIKLGQVMRKCNDSRSKAREWGEEVGAFNFRAIMFTLGVWSTLVRKGGGRKEGKKRREGGKKGEDL